MRTSALHGVATDRLVLAFLKHAQKLHLDRGRQLADLVEKQRAAARLGEAALAPRHRAGERAALVSEQLRFEDALGNRRAIDGHERSGGARRSCRG